MWVVGVHKSADNSWKFQSSLSPQSIMPKKILKKPNTISNVFTKNGGIGWKNGGGLLIKLM